MGFFKRIVALPEKFFFEVTIESLQIALPVECFIQIAVKRNQKKKETTAKYPYSPSCQRLTLDTRLTFPVTLYKTSSGYSEKFYFFRLVQTTSKRSLKNGKGSFNISNLLKSSPSFLSLPLKGCSDPKACLNLALSLSRIIKTESLNFGTIKGLPEFRGSRSFDHSPEVLSEEKKIKNREKYLRRIEKVNDYRNSPMSAVILQESDVSSCGSPASPQRFLDSPEKNKGTDGGFSITPIKIDFDEDLAGFKSPENEKNWENFIDSEKNSPVKPNNPPSLHEISEESLEIDKNLDTSFNVSDKNEPVSAKDSEQPGLRTNVETFREPGNSQDIEIDENLASEEQKPEKNSEVFEKILKNEEIPKNCFSEVQPNCNSKKELNNIEISSNENQEKCCKCLIV